MTNSVRSILMMVVSLLTVSVVVIAPSVSPPPPPKPTPTVQSAAVHLAAAVQPQALPAQPPLLVVLLNSPLQLLGPAAPFGTLPTPPAPAQFAIAPNLADT